MQSRRLVTIASLLAVLLSAAPGSAKIGTIDNVPGATLLFPHFEVDTQNPAGVDTLISLQNVSATSILLNVTLWTDYGLPTAHFPVYLTGFDQETIDLYNVFLRLAPQTASAGQAGNEMFSPRGPFSQHINFASCTGILPEVNSTGIWIGTEIVAAHTGGPSTEYFGGKCGSANYNDSIARGYVTVDTVNNCTNRRPSDPGYPASDLTNQNVMLGDWVLRDPAKHRLIADNAVAIEASPTDPLTSTTAGTKYTFYARFVDYHGNDNREPLPTAWAGFDSQGRTSIDYWRDPGEAVAPFTCGTTPSPFPMSDKKVTSFNASGGTVAVPPGNHFPIGNGSTPDSTLGATSAFGSLYLNMNRSTSSGPLNDIRQSWVTFRQVPRGVAANSNLNYAEPGVQLGNPNFNANPVIP